MNRKSLPPYECWDIYALIQEGEEMELEGIIGIGYHMVLHTLPSFMVEVYNSNEDNYWGNLYYSDFPTRIFEGQVYGVRVYIELNSTYVLLSWGDEKEGDSISCSVCR